MCVLTLLGATWSSAATSALVCPVATSRRTAISRGVSSESESPPSGVTGR